MNTQDENPYQGPQATVLATQPIDSDLATRTARLGAAFVDGVIGLVVVGPMMYFGGYFDAVRASGGNPPLSMLLLWLVIGFVVFVVIQGLPLKANGQTWGKKVASIRIVDTKGDVPSLPTLLFRRYLPVQAVSVIPCVGSILALVDILMIFREDHRCLHDHIAGTRVVSVR